MVFTHANTPTATIGTVKSTLKIPPRHYGVVPIKISGPLITTHTAYFITETAPPRVEIPTLTSFMEFTRSRTGHQSTFSSLITPIKTSPFTKENTLDILKSAVLDPTDQKDTHPANSITLKKMISETVTPDTFDPPQHELSAPIQDSLKLLLQE